MPRKLLAHVCAVVLLHACANRSLAQSDPGAEEPLKLDPFTVRPEQDIGYGAKFSAGASRINMDNLSISASVITLNENFLEDLKPMELFDVLKYVSGVAGNGNTLSSSQVTLRGYQTNIEFRDGIRELLGTNPAVGLYDPFSTSRMEIIKGPAGVLFGATTVGGIFNRVGKRPMKDPIATLRVTVGDDSFKRAEVDIGGPVAKSERWKYRAGAVWQDAETFLGGDYDRWGVFGVLQWSPTPTSDLWFRYEHQYNVGSITWSSWFMNRYGETSTFIDRNVVSNEPWDTSAITLNLLEFGATTRLTDRVASRLIVRYDFNDEVTEVAIKNAINFYDRSGNFLGREIPVGTTPAVSFADPQRFGSILLTRQRRYDWANRDSGSVNYDVTVNLDLGPTTHKAFVYSGFETENRQTNRLLWDYQNFDFLNPVYYSNPATLSSNERRTLNELRTNRAFNFGIQDNIGVLNDRIVAAVGARYDWAENTTVDPITNTNARGKGQDWTYKYGVVGKVSPGIVLFAQHSETFQPLGGTDHLGNPFKNLEGKNDEIGLKTELFGGALVSTISLFDARLKNQLIFGDTNPSTGRTEVFQIGQNKTQGWEMDFAWQATPSLAFLGGYGDLTSVNQLNIRIRHVPQGPNYKLFAKYSFTHSPLKGLELGLGYVYVSERAGDEGDNFSLPKYSTWDLMVNYQWKRVQLALMVRNLTDESYINTGGAERRAQIGEFRTIRLTTSLKF